VRRRIMGAMERADADGARAVIIEAIKLVEGGLATLCDEVWLVACDADVQRARLLGRGSDAADASARIAAQGDLVARLTPSATRVLDTSGSRQATRMGVDAALAEAISRTA
jgi:dephospho-CoA kinase